jgi:hypothetical protein
MGHRRVFNNQNGGTQRRQPAFLAYAALRKDHPMTTFFARALLPAAALLALAGCSHTLPENSRAAVPSGAPAVPEGTAAQTGTVISPNPPVPPTVTTTQVITTTPATTPGATVPVVTSSGIVNVPVGTSLVTVPGTVIYVPTQTASIAPGATLPARLSNNEIATLVAGNTATGIASSGQPYYLYFARDGRVRFRQGDFSDSGSWRVTNDGMLCTSMTKTNVGVEQCYALYREGTNVSFTRPDGAKVGSFTVLAGDPQNL